MTPSRATFDLAVRRTATGLLGAALALVTYWWIDGGLIPRGVYSHRGVSRRREGPDMLFTLSTTVAMPYAEAVAATREALSDQGFGILTEIDLAATMKAKLDVDLPPQVILGACRPALAHQAILADPSIAAVLPCNVVVRSLDESTTLVEAFDPDAMMGLASGREGGSALETVAADAKQRLTAALAALAEED